MKKIISIIAAAALTVSCFSCSDDKKKKEKTEEKPVNIEDGVNEPALDEPVKTEYKEFSEDSFNTIEVNLNVTDKEPPLTMHQLNTSQIDFGSVIPPCKAEKYRDRYRTDKSDYEDEEYQKFIREKWEKSCTEPQKGDIYCSCIDGNTFYIEVEYDNNCLGHHESAIFRVDGLTGEKEEVFRHSDPENSLIIWQLYSVNGVLYVLTREKGLYYLDEEKKELVNILEAEESRNYSAYVMGNSAGRLLIRESINHTEDVPKDYKTESGHYTYSDDGENYYIITGCDYKVKEFDFSSKTWTELYSAYEDYGENGFDSISGSKECPFIYGELFAWKEKPENSRKYDVCTESYKVSTGLTGCDILYASDKKLVLRQGSKASSSETSFVHVFDLESSTHYIIDYSGLGADNCKYAKDGIVVYPSVGSGKVYYIMPEIGLTFDLASFDSTYDEYALDMWLSLYDSYDNSLWFDINIKRDEREVTEQPGVIYKEYDYDQVKVWFTQEENNE